MGSSITVVKVGLVYASPLLLASFRFLFAGLLVMLLVIFLRKPHPTQLKDWCKICLIGLFQSTGVSVGIFVSLRTISASETSILTYMSPLFVVLLGTLFFQKRYRVQQWLGVFIGLLGIAIALQASIQLEVGVWFGFLAAVCWAVATLLVNKWSKQYNTWVLNAYQMLFGGLLLFLSSCLFEDPFFQVNPVSVFVVVWLVVIASIIQFAIWFYLIENEDPGRTSSFMFLAPLFGILCGWLFLQEPLQGSFLIGGVLVLWAIYLVNRQTSVLPQKSSHTA